LEAWVVSVVDGAGWWKYQYRVAQSIMAIWRVGLAAGLNSLLEGLEMDEMKRLSWCSVGLVKEWMCGRGSAGCSGPLAAGVLPWASAGPSSLFRSSVSALSSVWMTMVQPTGNALVWVLSSFDLKKSPAKTGITVMVCPSGR
jgi:hypothetical protein